MARLKFDSVFVVHSDGSLEAHQSTRVGGVKFGPGVRLQRGVAMGGIDFHNFLEKDLEVDVDGDTLVIKGIYTDVEKADDSNSGS